VTDIVTVRAPTPAQLEGWQRLEILDWLGAQGVPNRGVLQVEVMTIDAPMIAVTRKVMDDHGRSMVDPDRPHYLWRVTTDHLLRKPPPSWWQPA
jgi:hypothetical protein